MRTQGKSQGGGGCREGGEEGQPKLPESSSALKGEIYINLMEQHLCL